MFSICPVLPTHGHILHIGENAFELSSVKRTSPALALHINNQTFWGALYTGTPPAQTMRIQYDDEYWLGQNCDAGAYSENGLSQCTDCGIGHYCTGGIMRKPCTYGAIGCSTTNHATDAPAPDGAPINQLLTITDVNKFIPETNISQWKEISFCTKQKSADFNNPSSLNNPANACATGTVGPGTYLFITRYNPNQYVPCNPNCIDSIDGSNNISTAFIAVFDHPVGYASIHGSGIFQHFIDTAHPTYTEYTFSTASATGEWHINKNETNVQDIASKIPSYGLYVFELK